MIFEVSGTSCRIWGTSSGTAERTCSSSCLHRHECIATRAGAVLTLSRRRLGLLGSGSISLALLLAGCIEGRWQVGYHVAGSSEEARNLQAFGVEIQASSHSRRLMTDFKTYLTLTIRNGTRSPFWVDVSTVRIDSKRFQYQLLSVISGETDYKTESGVVVESGAKRVVTFCWKAYDSNYQPGQASVPPDEEVVFHVTVGVKDQPTEILQLAFEP